MESEGRLLSAGPDHRISHFARWPPLRSALCPRRVPGIRSEICLLQIPGERSRARCGRWKADLENLCDREGSAADTDQPRRDAALGTGWRSRLERTDRRSEAKCDLCRNREFLLVSSRQD